MMIYCISIEDATIGGVEWRYSRESRDHLISVGVPGCQGHQLIPFEIEVPDGTPMSQITKMADEAMWQGEFLRRSAA